MELPYGGRLALVLQASPAPLLLPVSCLPGPCWTRSFSCCSHHRHAVQFCTALPSQPTRRLICPQPSVRSICPPSIRNSETRPHHPHTLRHPSLLARTSSWDAWGTDSDDDAEDDLLAELAAKSQKAAAAARAASPAVQQLSKQPGSTMPTSPPAAPAASSSLAGLRAPPQLQRPAPATANLLLPYAAAALPKAASSTQSMPELHAPMKPQLDAARQRGRAGAPRSRLFPTTDPLIDSAYKGTQCTAYDALTGRKYARNLKDFNRLRHRPFSFTARLLENMLAARYQVPTPIQKRAMPAIARGRDVLATAPTGTGKTAAYLLPLIGGLLHMNSREGLPRNKAYPAMIVLVPTHELVTQVQEQCEALCRATHLRVVPLCGGQPIAAEVLAMRKGKGGGGADIVVATPGRLLHHVERRESIRLERLAHIVVDEADKMLNLGFEPELRRLMSHQQMPPQEMRQMVLFCATLPQEVRDLAAKLLKPHHIHIAAGLQSGAASLVSQHIIPVKQHTPEQGLPAVPGAPASPLTILSQQPPQPHPSNSSSGSSCSSIAPLQDGQPPRQQDGIGSHALQSAVLTAPSTHPNPDAGPLWANKLGYLARHVSDSRGGLTLVFTNTITQAAKVYWSLAELGHSVCLLHSGLTQESRDETIQCFRYGITPIMVATSIAARGLDVPDITHVINFDMPTDIHEYVYRIGRTGRAGRRGASTTLLALPKDAGMATELVTVMQGVQQAPPAWLVRLSQEQRLEAGGAWGRRPGGAHEENAAQQGQEQEQGQLRQPPSWLEALAQQRDVGNGLDGLPGQKWQQQPLQQQQGAVGARGVEQGGEELKREGDGHVGSVGEGTQASLSAADGGHIAVMEQGALRRRHDAQGAAPRPGASPLVMQSGDWSNAAFESGSGGGGGFAGAADRGDADRELQRSRLTAIEEGRRRKARAFNRYVSTWWGAGMGLAPMLDALQQQLLQRQLLRRQQSEQPQPQPQAEGEAGAQAREVAGFGRVGIRGSPAVAEMDDEQLVCQWLETIGNGLARLPSSTMRRQLAKRGGTPRSAKQGRQPVQQQSSEGAGLRRRDVPAGATTGDLGAMERSKGGRGRGRGDVTWAAAARKSTAGEVEGRGRRGAR